MRRRADLVAYSGVKRLRYPTADNDRSRNGCVYAACLKRGLAHVAITF
jgi:hypothetical protein